MDEVLLANFMVFHDLVESEPYDLWLGDEAWDVDYFLHENPELKTGPFVWRTDFVGWFPLDRGPDSREAFLSADYNVEMIEQVARFPRVRDRAIFVGKPDDVVPESFGPGLPAIRDWTERHYDACDLAVIQGGLSTCMELAAAGRPFLYFPLAGHFEQRFHVPHRLANYGAGTRMEYAETTPEALAAAIAAQLARPTRPRPVETDGARRAAELIAPLL